MCAAQMDLLSLGEADEGEAASSTGGTSSAAATAATSVTEDEKKQIQLWFNNATIAPAALKSVLYENPIVVVSVISEFRAHQGRLQLFVDNKTDKDFLQFVLDIPTVDYLAVRQHNIPVVVSAGEESRIQIAVDCMRPFDNYLSFSLSFKLSGVEYKYDLLFPVTVATFSEPVPTDKATYMARWKALENEVQEIFPCGKAMTSGLLQALRNKVFPALKIGLADELDATEKTATGSLSFRTGTPGPDGKPIAVGALLRLEADLENGRFRITVRSKHLKVSQAIKNIFKDQFA